MIDHGLSIDEQIFRARGIVRKRYQAEKFIAYFQSFTNTYASLHHLKALYDKALAHEGMVGLSVATRPDCIDMDILRLLAGYAKDYLVWIEYGLQSAHEPTLKQINRGHDIACFERSVNMANEWGLNICAHIILGLPGEDHAMMLQTARYLSKLPVQGIKIHLMYVVKGTPLADLYRNREFRCLEQEEYTDLVVNFLELLPPHMVIQRLTGDPLRSELVAPIWAMEKTTNLKNIREMLERRNTWQGRLYQKSHAGKCH
jgi:radical SAM protein (TIGR01212 family)